MGCNGSKSDGTENQSPPDNKRTGDNGGTQSADGQDSQGLNFGNPAAMLKGGLSSVLDKHVSADTQQDVKEFVDSPKRVIKEKVSEKMGNFGGSDSKEGSLDTPGTEQIENSLSKVESTADSSLSKVGSAAESSLSKAESTAESSLSKVGSTAESSLSKLESTADSSLSKLESKAESGLATLKEKADPSAPLESIKETVNQAGSRAKGALTGSSKATE